MPGHVTHLQRQVVAGVLLERGAEAAHVLRHGRPQRLLHDVQPAAGLWAEGSQQGAEGQCGAQPYPATAAAASRELQTAQQWVMLRP